MALLCITCGRELRDADAYCASCGAVPVKMAAPMEAHDASTPMEAQEATKPERWEICEVTWSKKKGLFAKWYFWARNLETGAPVITGTREFVPAGTSYGASSPDAGNPRTEAAFDEVLNLLRAAGWEAVTPSGASTGGRWSPQFRRSV
jgi:hypothetical protein